MLSSSWKSKRNQVELLIKKISDQSGGDEAAWLENYVKEVITQNIDNLDAVIAAAKSILLLWRA